MVVLNSDAEDVYKNGVKNLGWHCQRPQELNLGPSHDYNPTISIVEVVVCKQDRAREKDPLSSIYSLHVHMACSLI